MLSCRNGGKKWCLMCAKTERRGIRFGGGSKRLAKHSDQNGKAADDAGKATRSIHTLDYTVCFTRRPTQTTVRSPSMGAK